MRLPLNQNVRAGTLLAAFITLCISGVATPAAAGLTDTQKCLKGKLIHAGKFAKCVSKFESVGVTMGATPDAAKLALCNSKMDLMYGKLDTKFGGECITSADSDDRQVTLDACMTNVVTTLGGPGPAPGGVEAKCQGKKIKEAGKYIDCRFKALAKAVMKGEAPDYTKCETKIDTMYGKLEDKMDCLDETGTEVDTVKAELDMCFDDAAGDLRAREVGTVTGDCDIIITGLPNYTINFVDIDVAATPVNPPLTNGTSEDIELRILEMRFNSFNNSGFAEKWTLNTGTANAVTTSGGTGGESVELFDIDFVFNPAPASAATITPNAAATTGSFSISGGATELAISLDETAPLAMDSIVISGEAEIPDGGTTFPIMIECGPVTGDVLLPVE